MRPLVHASLVVTLILLVGAGTVRAQEPQGPGQKMPDRGQKHVPEGTRITYEENPPTSGPHWPVWARWGFYRESVPEEMFVHNLEHGGVVLLYNCPTPCPDVIRQLEALYPTLPPSKYGYPKVVVTSNNRIKRRFALLAWTRLDEFDRLDRDRVVKFVQAWQDKGPEDVP